MCAICFPVPVANRVLSSFVFGGDLISVFYSLYILSLQNASWKIGFDIFFAVTTHPSLCHHAAKAATAFRPVLLSYIHEATSKFSTTNTDDVSSSLFFFLSLADITHLYPATSNLAKIFLGTLPPLELMYAQTHELSISPRRLAAAFLLILGSIPESGSFWSHGAISTTLLTHTDPFCRWVGVRCTAVMIGLVNAQVDNLETQVLTRDEAGSCVEEWGRHCRQLQV